jgi:membrane-bound lytic murein transglycosylase D
MRRNFLEIAGLYPILALAILILPLFGCASSTDLSSDSANQISVTGVRENTVRPASAADAPAMSPAQDASQAQLAELLSAGEISTLSLTPPMLPVVRGLPFVRSQPKLVPPFPLVLNRAVQSYIDGYLAQPQMLRESFQRSSPFMPEMVSLFNEDGLPPDLVYLAFAESAFSPEGAGPWQLSKATARRYGLTINQWLDERRDPIKSTRAAAEYLAELHDQTGDDWRMTLVAWNNGDGGVLRYLRLMTAPYERLMKRLPRRTSALMNRFMAVALIARHAKEYGLEAVSWRRSPQYRVIAVDGNTSLRTIAQSNHTSVARLRSLNPALLCDRTPPGPQSYPIRIPEPGDTKLVTSS